jgi:hypothetical protein
MVKTFFKSIGLQAIKADPNLFVSSEVYLLLFVNNIMLVGVQGYVKAIVD